MHEFIGASPLSFMGGGQQKQQQQQQYQVTAAPTIDQPQPEETNAERHYRDVANFCEVVAPAAIGSAVVFAFHTMQVAGGSVFAIGIYQIYLLAGLKQNLSPNQAQTGFISGKYVHIFLQPAYKSIRYSCSKS
jgi:hypothetical protein